MPIALCTIQGRLPGYTHSTYIAILRDLDPDSEDTGLFCSTLKIRKKGPNKHNFVQMDANL